MQETPPGFGPVWRLNPLVNLHWRIWGSACAVFEAVSGETAAVDALEAAALACFDDCPQDLKRLVASLAGDLGMEPGPALQERVQGIVQECLARGWLEPVESGQ